MVLGVPGQALAHIVPQNSECLPPLSRQHC